MPKKPSFFYGYIIVGAAFFIMVLMYGTFFSFVVFFKPVLTEFGWSRAITSGAYSLGWLLSGALAMITGRLTDQVGPRMVVVVCGFILGLGYILMSQIGAIWQLYLFYGVIVSLGMGGSFTPLLSPVARWFVRRRGLMTGMAISGIGFGTLITPPIANWLISNYSWRTSYTIIGVTVSILIVLAAQLLRRDPGEMGLVPYGGDAVEENSINWEAGGFSLKEAIHTRRLWILFTLYVCTGFYVQFILVHIVIHATGLGFSAPNAAVVLSIIGAGSVVGRVTTGSAADRIGNKLAYSIALILIVVAFFWLQLAQEAWMLYLFAAVFGLAYGGILCLMSPLVAELFGLRSHGVILGVIMFSSTIGGAIGPIVAGYIFDITSSYKLVFLVCAIIGIVSLVLLSFLRPAASRGRTNESGKSA